MAQGMRASLGYCSSSHTLFTRPVSEEPETSLNNLISRKPIRIKCRADFTPTVCVWCVCLYPFSAMMTVLVVVVTVSIELSQLAEIAAGLSEASTSG